MVMMCIATACKKNEVETSEPSVKAAWSSSAQYGNWSNGGYTVYNNVWGAGAGSQNIWANSYSNWGIWANHPNTGGIKSYPNSSKYVGRTLSSLASCSTSFNSTTPAGGSWSSTYDIWDSAKNYETMLWMNYTGNVKPISSTYDANGNAVPVYTNVSVGGHTWNVYKGPNGSITVFSFLRTSKTNSGTIDVLAIQRWIQARGWFGNITLGDVQYGYEITSCWGTNGSGANFTCNSYSVSFN